MPKLQIDGVDVAIVSETDAETIRKIYVPRGVFVVEVGLYTNGMILCLKYNDAPEIEPT